MRKESKRKEGNLMGGGWRGENSTEVGQGGHRVHVVQLPRSEEEKKGK